ncbi:MAG: type II toxin-antitoxin system HicB family antitoxin [Ignavibacteriae bacterium]|nr:MAG: type II toxin-antitoxin system HicB family antitoxin [Ignavibacteriota bacterium]
MEYLIIIEKSKTGYSAYPPDLPGVGVTGKTKKLVLALIKEAIEFHLEDIYSSGKKIPKPKNEAATVTVKIKAA